MVVVNSWFISLEIMHKLYIMEQERIWCGTGREEGLVCLMFH